MPQHRYVRSCARFASHPPRRVFEWPLRFASTFVAVCELPLRAPKHGHRDLLWFLCTPAVRSAKFPLAINTGTGIAKVVELSAASMPLHRKMVRADLDALLADAYSVTNTFEAEHLFDAAKDVVAWSSVQRALKLNDGDSVRLVLALKNADKGKVCNVSTVRTADRYVGYVVGAGG